jgi:transcription-repair coupling factor (superfamily II helicase)
MEANVNALDRVSRYTGAPSETAPLHKLGSDAWEKAKRKAAQRIHDTAAELLDLYSRRAARQGEQLVANEVERRTFEAAFPLPMLAPAREASTSIEETNIWASQVLAGAAPADRAFSALAIDAAGNTSEMSVRRVVD